jgi:hypothetical protein
MLKNLFGSVVMCAAFAPCLAVAAGSPALPPLTAAQVVDKNVAARGGLAAWRSVQSMSWKGKMGAGATMYTTVTPAGKMQTKEREEAYLPFTLEFKRPNKTRLGIEFNGQLPCSLHDGAGVEAAPVSGAAHRMHTLPMN